MNHLKNKQGIALITALLLTLIGLAVILAALHFVTQGTILSGMHKRYSTSLEAAHGGVEIIAKEIIPKTIAGTTMLQSLGSYGDLVSYQVSDNCFIEKMTKATANWDSSLCTADNTSLDLKKSDGTNIADVTLTLLGTAPQPNFKVYTKIVDTVPGNSDTSGLVLEGFGVVESGSGIVTPQHFPYTYRVEVQGERETNPDERANISVLYAY